MLGCLVSRDAVVCGACACSATATAASVALVAVIISLIAWWAACAFVAACCTRIPPSLLCTPSNLSSGLVLPECAPQLRAGPELLQHDISVPSISVVCGSSACFAVAETCRACFVYKLSATLQAAMDGAFMVALATLACFVRPSCTLLALLPCPELTPHATSQCGHVLWLRGPS
jgi:hypothetical protein